MEDQTYIGHTSLQVTYKRYRNRPSSAISHSTVSVPHGQRSPEANNPSPDHFLQILLMLHHNKYILSFISPPRNLFISHYHKKGKYYKIF